MKVEQGEGTAYHLMPLGNLLDCVPLAPSTKSLNSGWCLRIATSVHLSAFLPSVVDFTSLLEIKTCGNYFAIRCGLLTVKAQR